MWVHYLVRNALVYCRGCLRLRPKAFLVATDLCFLGKEIW